MHRVVRRYAGWVALGLSMPLAAETVDTAAALLERMDRNVDWGNGIGARPGLDRCGGALDHRTPPQPDGITNT